MKRNLLIMLLAAVVGGLTTWAALHAKRYGKSIDSRPVPVVNEPWTPPTVVTDAERAASPYELILKSAGGLGKVGERPLFERHLSAVAINRAARRVYVAGDRKLLVFDHCDESQGTFELSADPVSIAVDQAGNIYVGQDGQIERLTPAGEQLALISTARLGKVTGLAVLEDGTILAADGPAAVVRKFSQRGEHLGDIRPPGQGAGGEPAAFDAPRKNFDLAALAGDRFVVGNTRPHRVEIYDPAGNRLSAWGDFSETDRALFQGCCNPCNVASYLLADERRVIVTAEKRSAPDGQPRVKVYTETGKLLALVTSPAIGRDNETLDLAVDDQGRIYVADPANRVVHRFAPAK